MEQENNDRCRHCSSELGVTVVDLGASPLCNELVTAERLEQVESFYPLHAKVCAECLLVQVGTFVSPGDIFSEYSYFSSYSEAMVHHARQYVDDVMSRYGLNRDSLVMEVASNDGYLLQHFVPHGVPVLGIEPAKNVAQVAIEKGIRTTVQFLGSDTARGIVAKYGAADLVAANNVAAHTPYLNDFILGLAKLIKPDGVVSVEFAHVVPMLADNLYDTIYHEHFCYFSLFTFERVLNSQGLRVFDVEEVDTHGGSLRVWACSDLNRRSETERLQQVRKKEHDIGVHRIATYSDFHLAAEHSKRELLKCLIELKERQRSIVGYGVPGKGNTLLNYCGIRTDFLDYMVDRNPYKQGKFTPGTRIPILPPEKIRETKPDYVLIMPWNLVEEITAQLGYVSEWGGKFIVPLPEVSIIDEGV